MQMQNKIRTKQQHKEFLLLWKIFKLYIRRQTKSKYVHSKLNILTSVFVPGFVNLSVSTFSNNSDDIKFIHAAFSPVNIFFFDFTIARPTYSIKYSSEVFIDNQANWMNCLIIQNQSRPILNLLLHPTLVYLWKLM